MAAPAGNPTPPANTNGTAGQSSDEHRLDIEIWPDDKASNGKEGTPSESGLPTIPRVPATLKNNQNLKLPQWIKPNVVSIGPYYYCKHKNLLKLQKQKPQHAKKFIEESNQDRDALYDKIIKETPELMKCYDNQQISEYKENKLATIFLLDGCFLLRFIYHSSDKGACSKLGFTNHEMAYIKHDLFLLENQLPYRVLQLLFEEAKFTNEDRENSKNLMQDRIKYFVADQVPFPRRTSVKEVEKPCHLLHYLQGVILEEPGTGQNQGKENKEAVRPKCHLLHYLQGVILDEPGSGQNQRKENKEAGRPKWHSCTVQELRNVGIHFKRSPTSYLTDISFKSHFCASGCLKLPTISMNTSTMIIFLNLIAFESSNATKDTTNGLSVISYLCFLDSLIDRWDDVKELEAAGILHNFVGEKREVAQFFNHVCSKLEPTPSAYNDVMLQIENHVHRHKNTRWRNCYIQFKQKYFSSPWSFIALIGAVIGLLLTATEVYASVVHN